MNNSGSFDGRAPAGCAPDGTGALPGVASKPMQGTWTLTAPDGRSWQAQSPALCMFAEVRSRVSPELALKRILDAAHSTEEIHEGRNSQHVLKAEGASPDATDRENCAMASLDGGPMGAGQPAAAGPAGGQWRMLRPPQFLQVSWGPDAMLRPINGMAVSEYAFRVWAAENGIALYAR